jgi:hypothetical protein
MLDQSLQQYKEMYRHVTRNWATVVEVSEYAFKQNILLIINRGLRALGGIWKVTAVTAEVEVSVPEIQGDQGAVLAAMMMKVAMEGAVGEGGVEA